MAGLPDLRVSDAEREKRGELGSIPPSR